MRTRIARRPRSHRSLSHGLRADRRRRPPEAVAARACRQDDDRETFSPATTCCSSSTTIHLLPHRARRRSRAHLQVLLAARGDMGLAIARKFRPMAVLLNSACRHHRLGRARSVPARSRPAPRSGAHAFHLRGPAPRPVARRVVLLPQSGRQRSARQPLRARETRSTEKDAQRNPRHQRGRRSAARYGTSPISKALTSPTRLRGGGHRQLRIDPVRLRDRGRGRIRSLGGRPLVELQKSRSDLDLITYTPDRRDHAGSQPGAVARRHHRAHGRFGRPPAARSDAHPARPRKRAAGV